MINALNFFNPFVTNTDHDRFDDNDRLDRVGHIFQAVNEYRASIRRPSLILLSSICDLTECHSQYLAAHDIRQGDRCHTDWSERMPSSGNSNRRSYRYEEILSLPQRFSDTNENIATVDLPALQLNTPERQPEIADAILQEWLASKRGYRETVEGTFTHCGIGVVIRQMPEAGDQSLVFVTCQFAR